MDYFEEGYKFVLANEGDPRNLSDFSIQYLYRRYFWNFYNIHEIHNPVVAIKCFDMYVNMNNHAVAGIIQNSVNLCSLLKIKVDHVVGPVTITALNECNSNCIIPNLVQQSEEYYRNIAKGPLAKDLAGWLKRAAKIPIVNL